MKCGKGEGNNEGAGLYQWVVQTGNQNHSVSVFSRHFVCRTGPTFNQAPNCPWNACLDAQCNICSDAWRQ